MNMGPLVDQMFLRLFSVLLANNNLFLVALLGNKKRINFWPALSLNQFADGKITQAGCAYSCVGSVTCKGLKHCRMKVTFETILQLQRCSSPPVTKLAEVSQTQQPVIPTPILYTILQQHGCLHGRNQMKSGFWKQ